MLDAIRFLPIPSRRATMLRTDEGDDMIEELAKALLRYTDRHPGVSPLATPIEGLGIMLNHFASSQFRPVDPRTVPDDPAVLEQQQGKGLFG